LPVEVALIRHDEVVSLLAALGATVDVPVNSPNMTLLQRISAMLKKLRTPSVLGTTQEPPIGTWAQYNAYLAAVPPTKDEEGSVKPEKTRSTVVPHLDEEHALAMTDYYVRVESILHAYSVMPQTSQCDETPTSQTSGQQHGAPKGTGYACHTKYGTVPIPAHLKVFYDELYEACWTGDNATIQELCLPKHLEESNEPIQISVTTVSVDSVHNLFAQLTGMLILNFQLRLSCLTLPSQGGLLFSSRCIVATELLAFAGHMEGKLAIEMARKSAAGKDTEGGDGNNVNPVAPQGTTASTYALLLEAVAARPGHRQLVHLTDVQHSVKRGLKQAEKNALFALSRRIPKSDEEVDPEE
jgi:hypothetical protein